MLIASIAFRNIFRHKRRSLLTGLLMAGGCMLFSLFLGIVEGSYGSLIELFTRAHTGHVQIHAVGFLDKPSLYKTIKNPDAVGAKVMEDRAVRGWSPRLLAPVLIFSGAKSTGLKLMGIDPERESKVTTITKSVSVGRFISGKPAYEVVINDNTARVLGVEVGSEIAIIGQAADGSIANNLFNVVGIIEESGSSYDKGYAYMHIDAARELMSFYGGEAHEIAIALSNHEASIKEAGRIRKLVDDPLLDVEPWQVVEEQFYKAMLADLKGHRISIIVFTIIIAIGVLNTVLMVILERTREYGVLRAVGTRPSGIFKMIVFETAFLAALSSAVGVVLGLCINLYFMLHGIKMPEPVHYGGIIFDSIVSNITPITVILPVAIIMSSAILVSLLPAIRASQIEPVKAMRSY